jgi:Ca2+-binding RTX toxin-like protein
MVTKTGTSGDDTLVGTKFKDKLFGLDGNDTLKGLGGNDTLSGGDGKDTFVFGAKSGKDVVTDFDVKKDILEITKSNVIKSLDDVAKHTHSNGKDIFIDLGHGSKIVLKGVTLEDFKKDIGGHVNLT